MNSFRTLLLAGIAVIGASSAAPAADASDHRRIQGSIYDVLRGEYQAPIAGPVLVEGRASASGPPPMDQWERRQQSSDPYYFRHATETHD